MPVEVSPYDPTWPTTFQQIQSRLSDILKNVPILSIEHVGSTSVPGLPAKPIVDIDIIITREILQQAIDALVNASFTYFGELGVQDRHAFRDPEQHPPRNVYVVIANSYQSRNHLGLRDTLRKDAQLRDEYGSAKLEIARKGLEIHEYVDAKSDIIQKILKASGVLSADELKKIEEGNQSGGGERIASFSTARLTLREFTMADVDAVFRLESQDEVVRYQFHGPFTAKKAHEYVAMVMVDGAALPRQLFELAVLYDGEFVGRVGAQPRDMEDADSKKSFSEEQVRERRRNMTVWYSFLPEVQGRGFATEALGAFLPLLGKGTTVEIECDPRNIPSWKVAEKLGFERISLTEDAFESKGEKVGSLVYQKVI